MKVAENTEKINTNANSIANLKNDLAYFSNELSLMKSKGYQSSSINSSNNNSDIIVIEDELTDKNSLYTYAYEKYNNGDFTESRKKFNEFLSLYPNDDLSDNALYWIGETYYAEKN